jgi:hypothetical protein
VRNVGGNTQVAKVAAVCSSELDVVTQIQSFPLPADNFANNRVLCSEDRVATGGGVVPANTSTAVLTGHAPLFSREPNEGLLFVQPNGENPAPVGWQGVVLNEALGVSTMRVAAVCVPEPSRSAQALGAALALAIGWRIRRGQPPHRARSS